MAAKRIAPHLAVAIGMPQGGGPPLAGRPGTLQDEEGDLRQDVEDVINALREAAPNDPRIDLVERILHELLADVAPGSSGGDGDEGAPGQMGGAG